MSLDSGRNLDVEVGRVMQSIGRCVIVYQRIELHLKYLLPHVGGPNQMTGDTFAQWRSLLDSKTTLGQLMTRLSGCARSTDPEGFGRYIGDLVVHRNELIHHFCQLPFGRLNSVEQCDAALAYLNGRMEFALPLYQALTEIMEQFVDALLQWKMSDAPTLEIGPAKR